MDYYMKLHQLAFRRDTAAAAHQCAGEKVPVAAANVRQLLQVFGARTNDAVVIAQGIAVHEAALAEQRFTASGLRSATSAFEELRAYLEDHIELMPEGIPDSL